MAEARDLEQALLREIGGEAIVGRPGGGGKAPRKGRTIDPGVHPQAEDEGVAGEEGGGEGDLVFERLLAAFQARGPGFEGTRLGEAPTGKLTGGGRAIAEPLLHLPGVEVVLAGVAGAGVVGNLILGKSGALEDLPGGLVEGRFVALAALLHFATLELYPQLGVLFEGEAVGRKVGRSDCERRLQVPPPIGQALPRHGEDQVEVEILEAGGMDRIDCPKDLPGRVLAPEAIEHPLVEALHPHGEPGHAEVAQNGEFVRLHRGRSHFHRPFCRGSGQDLEHLATKGLEVGRAEQPGRAPAPEGGARVAPRCRTPKGLLHGLQIAADRLPLRCLLIKSAEVAGGRAKGHVDIDSKRFGGVRSCLQCHPVEPLTSTHS